MNYEERIKKLKQSIDQKKDLVFDELTEEELLEKLKEQEKLADFEFNKRIKSTIKKIEEIEKKANQKITSEKIIKLLEGEGIRIKNMPDKDELEGQLKHCISTEAFNRFRNQIGDNAEMLAANMQESDNKIKELSSKLYELNHQLEQEQKNDRVKSERRINYLKEKIDKVKKEIKEKKFEIRDDLDLKGYKITNLAAPTKESDAANKKYTDDAARKAALALQGGGGTHIHIGPNPPSDPKLNALWIQI